MAEQLLTVKRAYRATEGSNLDQTLTTSWTDGSSLSVEDVVDFEPDGGEAVLEADTASEELIKYGGVDEVTSQLSGVLRPGPRFAHASGKFVQQGATATTEMLLDGFFEDEAHPVTGILVPPHLEFQFALGVREAEDMESVPVDFVDDEYVVTGGPVGTPAVFRTDNDEVVIASARGAITISADGLFELADVNGSPPPGTPGILTLYFDTLGGSGAGFYGRRGTNAPVRIAAF